MDLRVKKEEDKRKEDEKKRQFEEWKLQQNSQQQPVPPVKSQPSKLVRSQPVQPVQSQPAAQSQPVQPQPVQPQQPDPMESMLALFTKLSTRLDQLEAVAATFRPVPPTVKTLQRVDSGRKRFVKPVSKPVSSSDESFFDEDRVEEYPSDLEDDLGQDNDHLSTGWNREAASYSYEEDD